MAGPPNVYVFKRGDALSKVAKANGLKSGKFLFDHKLNKKLKTLRKKPE